LNGGGFRHFDGIAAAFLTVKEAVAAYRARYGA
jgi:hypothetical protein